MAHDRFVKKHHEYIKWFDGILNEVLINKQILDEDLCIIALDSSIKPSPGSYVHLSDIEEVTGIQKWVIESWVNRFHPPGIILDTQYTNNRRKLVTIPDAEFRHDVFIETCKTHGKTDPVFEKKTYRNY